MKVQNNICEGSLITNYLPADYCDSFSKTIVSDKVVTPEVLTILLLLYSSFPLIIFTNCRLHPRKPY